MSVIISVDDSDSESDARKQDDYSVVIQTKLQEPDEPDGGEYGNQ
jgi:hypothetical protein